jgi:iron(III) transport system permease protein
VAFSARTVLGRLGGAGAVRRDRAPFVLWAAALLAGLAALLPVIYLIVRTAGAGGEVWDLFFRARTAAILGRTLLLISTVTAFSALVAVPVAWLTLRTDLPFRRVLSVATALPLVVPSYVMAMVIIEAFGPRGLLQGLLETPFGLHRLPEVYGLRGATLAVVLVSYPYVLLTVRGALRRQDPALEEAARSMGYGPLATFRQVTLPLLRPALAAGALLAALYALSDFGAVSLLRYETFTAAVFVQYESAFDRAVAASLALALAGLAVVLLAAEDFSRGRQAYHRSTAGAVRPGRVVELGNWRWPAFTLVMLPVAAGLLVPLAVICYWLAQGLARGTDFAPVLGPAGNSVYVSVLAALVTVAAAAPVAVLAVRHRSLVSRAVERVTYIGFGLPGIAVALSLVFFAINVARPLYQTVALLTFAYLVLFMPAAVGALRASLLQVSPRVEEAAMALGRTPARVLFTVTLPLVLPGALTGGAMVFLLTMKELPATLILGPIGFDTLATSVWSSASEGLFSRAAWPALLLVIAAGAPTAFLLLRGQAYGDPSRSRAMGPGRPAGLPGAGSPPTLPEQETD